MDLECKKKSLTSSPTCNPQSHSKRHTKTHTHPHLSPNYLLHHCWLLLLFKLCILRRLIRYYLKLYSPHAHFSVLTIESARNGRTRPMLLGTLVRFVYIFPMQTLINPFPSSPLNQDTKQTQTANTLHLFI